jgi:4-aminobutyrate aminotransferase-like enzyme
VIVNENLVEKAASMGEKMRAGLRALQNVGPDGGWISEVRGKGLLNAIVIEQGKSKRGRSAWDLCLVRLTFSLSFSVLKRSGADEFNLFPRFPTNRS